MKNAFPILLLLSAVALTSGQASIGSWQSFNGMSGDLPVVNLLESSPTHIIVEISIPGFWLYDYPAGGRSWNCVSLPECYTQGDIGLPDLPSVPRLFALPFGTEAVVTVEDVSSTVYSNMEILPRQTPEIDMAHEPFAFRIDEEFYSGSKVFPASFANVDNEGVWSGLNVARLVINPFRFNPETSELEVVGSITIRVDFEGVPGELANPVNPSMIPMMKESVINWSTFENAAAPIDGSRDEGIEYVFVCTEDNVDLVSDLFETHHYLGLHTRIEALVAPATSAQIKSVIASNYQSGVTRFVCIVGTHSELPSYEYSSFESDYYYACIDGDNYPDVALGRLTGNSAQLTNQVSKILDGYMDYAFDSKIEGIIPSETVLAAHEEDYPYKYTRCCNQVADYPYNLCDVTFIKVYPPEGGTAADVSEAINSGVGTVGYRGHGDKMRWQWSPGWNFTHINALTNNYMPPVFNVACDNGDYAPIGACLCEAWQWAEHGASGSLGATKSTLTIPNHDYMKQIYIALYNTGTYRVGEAINSATIFVIQHHGGSGISNARSYIWFGDPAMDVWTFDTEGEPGALEISAPSNILPGNQDIAITVTDGGSPVEGANVTITDGVNNYGDGMTFYQEGATNSSGQVILNITAPSSGTIHIGAFLHDYNYDIIWILIGESIEDAEGFAPMLTIHRLSPNPITVSASIGFSIPNAGSVELAVYDVSGRMVETLLEGMLDSGNHTMQWTPDFQTASGFYFIRLTTEEGTLSRHAVLIR